MSIHNDPRHFGERNYEGFGMTAAKDICAAICLVLFIGSILFIWSFVA